MKIPSGIKIRKNDCSLREIDPTRIDPITKKPYEKMILEDHYYGYLEELAHATSSRLGTDNNERIIWFSSWTEKFRTWHDSLDPSQKISIKDLREIDFISYLIQNEKFDIVKRITVNYPIRKDFLKYYNENIAIKLGLPIIQIND